MSWFRRTLFPSSTPKIKSISTTTSATTTKTITNNIKPTIVNKIPTTATTQTTKVIPESVSVVSSITTATTTPHPLNDVYKFMREGIVSSIFFLILMLFSHFLIRRYIRKKDDEKKIYIPRFLCTVCLSISIAAMLLIPITIISNEIMTTFPSSYYTQWLDRELIFSFWNKIFWGANISLFIILPFTYFLYESEGIRGRSLLNRVKEALLILLLVAVIFISFIFIIFKLFYGQQKKQPSNIMDIISIISTDYLPFSYSLISTFGTYVVMWSIPSGFNFLISKCISLRIIKPVEDEIKAAKMEIESITFTLDKAEAAGFVNLKPKKKSKFKKRLSTSCSIINNNSNCNNDNNNKKDNNSKNGSLKSDKIMNHSIVNSSDIISSQSSSSSPSSSSPSLSPSSSSPQYSAINSNSNSITKSISNSNISNIISGTTTTPLIEDNIPKLNIDLNICDNTIGSSSNSSNRLKKQQNETASAILNSNKKLNNFKITQAEIQRLEDTRDELYLYIDKISRPSYFSSSVIRVLTSVVLTLINFLITGWVIFKVFITLVKRIFELFELESIKLYFDTWMSSAIDFSKGSSKLGPFESLFETTIIIYLMISAFVGFLNEPYFAKIKPRIHSTSLRKMIINTGIILLMSSSFPVVVRTLEISSFDLMGYYSHTNYLRNDIFKILYRISFLLLIARSYMKSFKGDVNGSGLSGENGAASVFLVSSTSTNSIKNFIIFKVTSIIPSFILNKVLSNSARNKIIQIQQLQLQQELFKQQQLQLQQQQQQDVVKSIQSLVLNDHHVDSASNPSSSLFSIIAKNQNLINIQDLTSTSNSSINTTTTSLTSSPSLQSLDDSSNIGGSTSSGSSNSSISSAPSSPSLRRILPLTPINSSTNTTTTNNNNNNNNTATKNQFKNKKLFFF